MFLSGYKIVGMCDDKSIFMKDGGVETVEVARRLLMKEHTRGDYDAHVLECLEKDLNFQIVKLTWILMV